MIKHGEEFKQEAVRLCLRHDRSIGQVARELDLTESALRKWVKQYEIDRGPNPTGALTTEEKTELCTLRREVRVLREEREILKKRRPSSPRQTREVRVDSRGEGHARRARLCRVLAVTPSGYYALDAPTAEPAGAG